MQFSLFIKTGFLAVDLCFILFLLVAARQVFAMNKIINDDNDSFFVKTSVLLLLIFAVSLFLTALVIL
jgi:hypothetical protein